MQHFLNQLLAYAGSLPGAVNLGIIWGLMALGVFITYKVLDVADLTVDGSFAMGGIVCAIFIQNGGNFAVGLLLGFIAGVLCGLVTGLLHTLLGIPPILAGILTQLACWSINLKIASGAPNISVNARTTTVLVSQLDKYNALWILFLAVAVIVALLYIFFGTQLGASIRATGNNQKMGGTMARGPKYTWEETLATFALYLMLPSGQHHKGNKDVIALANALGRPPSSISFKLGNIKSHDPSKQGTGLPNGSKLDGKVWEAYSERGDALAEEALDLLIAAVSTSSTGGMVVEYLSKELPEGKDRTVVATARCITTAKATTIATLSSC